MSRKLDSVPVTQKKCHGRVTPSSPPRAERISRAGIIVAKLDRFSRTLVGGLQTLEVAGDEVVGQALLDHPREDAGELMDRVKLMGEQIAQAEGRH